MRAEYDEHVRQSKLAGQERLGKILAGHEANRRPMELNAPYWREGDGFSSTMVINNTFPRAIDITPVVRNANGQELTAKTIRIRAKHTEDVALSDIVAGIQGHGQIALRYNGEPLEINAVMVISNAERSLVVDHAFEKAEDMSGAKLEGLFYVPRSSTNVEIAFANASTKPLAISLAVTPEGEQAANSANEEYSLAPYETKVVNVRPLLDKSNGRVPIAGRAVIQHSGSPGDLRVHGMLLDSHGFSANMRILDSSALASSKLFSPVLPLGDQVRPIVLFANPNAERVTVRLEAYYKLRDVVEETTLAVLSVPPTEALHIDLTREISGLPTGAVDVGVSFSLYGSLLADVLLIDRSGSGVYQVSPKGYGAHQHDSHSFPFRIGGSLNTIITIANPSETEEVTYVLNFFYDGKTYGFVGEPLRPGEVRNIDIRRLRDERVPGHRKEIIPAETVKGHASLHFLKPKNAAGSNGYDHSAHYRAPLGFASATTFDTVTNVAIVTCLPDCSPEWFWEEVENQYYVGLAGDGFGLSIAIYNAVGGYYGMNPNGVNWLDDGGPITDATGLDVSLLTAGFTSLDAHVDLSGNDCGGGCPCNEVWGTEFPLPVWVESYPVPDVTFDGFDTSEEAEEVTFDLTLSGGIQGASYTLVVEASRQGQSPVTVYSGTLAAGPHTVAYLAQGNSLPAGTYTGLLTKWGPGPQRMIPYGVIHEGCSDARSDIILEYWVRNRNEIPSCHHFTTMRGSTYFSFQEINTGDYAFALVRDPFIAPSASGFGMDKWREEYGSARSITPHGGYRNPSNNYAHGGAPESRHQYGDGADLDVVSNAELEWTNLRDAAARSDPDFIEPSNGPCGYGCVHADWRDHPGGY